MVNYKKCCYFECKSHSKFDQDVTFLIFPKPKRNKERCLKWIEASGNPKLTLETINQRHYVCSRHFMGGPEPVKGYLNAKPYYGENNENAPMDLSTSKDYPLPVSNVKKSIKPQIYFAKNFASSDFNADFFQTYGNNLVEKTCADMKDAHLEGESVVDFIQDLSSVKFNLSAEVIETLALLSTKNIKDKGSFVIHARQLREKPVLTLQLISLFGKLDGFRKIDLKSQELVVFNWLRRFMANVLSQWVALKPNVLDSELKGREFPVLTLKEIRDKEDQVIHHIGGYIMRKIAKRYEEPMIVDLLENCIAKEGFQKKSFAEWTNLISKGGLLSLTIEGFKLFKMLDQFTKPFYENVNKIEQLVGQNKTRKEMVIARLKETNVINQWNIEWGSKNLEHRERAMSLVFDTFINCRASALRNYTQIKFNEANHKALAKKKSLRRLLKESSLCTCKVTCYCKSERS